MIFPGFVVVVAEYSLQYSSMSVIIFKIKTKIKNKSVK